MGKRHKGPMSMIRTLRVSHLHVLVVAGEEHGFHKITLAAGLRARQRGQGGSRSLGCSREVSYGVVTIMQSGRDGGQDRGDSFRTSEVPRNSATILKVELARLMCSMRLPGQGSLRLSREGKPSSCSQTQATLASPMSEGETQELLSLQQPHCPPSGTSRWSHILSIL